MSKKNKPNGMQPEEEVTVKVTITDSQGNQTYYSRRVKIMSNENLEPSENTMVNSEDGDKSTDDISS